MATTPRKFIRPGGQLLPECITVLSDGHHSVVEVDGIRLTVQRGSCHPVVNGDTGVAYVQVTLVAKSAEVVIDRDDPRVRAALDREDD